MKASDEKDEYLIETKMPIFNGFENIVENGAFAHNEQMLRFPQYLQINSNLAFFLSIRYSFLSSDAFIGDESKIAYEV